MSKESINEWINSQELTTEDLDFMWNFCIVFGHPVISKLGMASWKDLHLDLIKQIPNEYEKMVEKVIYNNKDYEIIEFRGIFNSRKYKST